MSAVNFVAMKHFTSLERNNIGSRIYRIIKKLAAQELDAPFCSGFVPS